MEKIDLRLKVNTRFHVLWRYNENANEGAPYLQNFSNVRNKSKAYYLLSKACLFSTTLNAYSQNSETQTKVK